MPYIKGEKPAAMQHANRSSIFDNTDSHGGGSTINNNNHSIGAIGASTSSGMVPFAQNSILLMLLSSLHLAYWQLCKLFDMSNTHKRKQKKTKRKFSSSSLKTTTPITTNGAASEAIAILYCQSCYVRPQYTWKPPQIQLQLQQQGEKVEIEEKCLNNLHWVLNRIAVALIFHYHKIES